MKTVLRCRCCNDFILTVLLHEADLLQPATTAGSLSTAKETPPTAPATQTSPTPGNYKVSVPHISLLKNLFDRLPVKLFQ